MHRLLPAPLALLALAACMHNAVPVANAPLVDPGPLEARIYASQYDLRSITVDLNRPAYVAVFAVIPGQGTLLLYPRLGQARLFEAGRNYPVIYSGNFARTASGSAFDWVSGNNTFWTTSGSWTQPRHIFLVASEVPLRTDGFEAWSARGAGVLTHPRFASFSANATMGHLLNAVLPSVSDGQWSTDVYTIWPEPPAPSRRLVAVTDFPIWLNCAGNFYFVPAGTPVSTLRRYLQSDCRVVPPPQNVDSTQAAESPGSAGKRLEVPDQPRDPKAMPERPGMPRTPRVNPIAASGRQLRAEPSERSEPRTRARAPLERVRTEPARGRPIDRTATDPVRARPVDRAAAEPVRARPQPIPRRAEPARTNPGRVAPGSPARRLPVADRGDRVRSTPAAPASAPARETSAPMQRPSTPASTATPQRERPQRELPPASGTTERTKRPPA